MGWIPLPHNNSSALQTIDRTTSAHTAAVHHATTGGADLLSHITHLLHFRGIFSSYLWAQGTLTLTQEWRPDGEQGLLVPLGLNIHMVLSGWDHHPSLQRDHPDTKMPPAPLPPLQRHTHTLACNVAWQPSSCSSKLIWRLYREAGQKYLITMCVSVARCSNYIFMVSEQSSSSFARAQTQTHVTYLHV